MGILMGSEFQRAERKNFRLNYFRPNRQEFKFLLQIFSNSNLVWSGYENSWMVYCCCSVTRSCLTLQSHGLQHTRLPCPSPSPGVCSNSCPSSWWCHSTTSSSVIPFPSCLQSFPASGSFPMSQLFTPGGQSIGSFSFSICPFNEYSGLISFRIDWLDLLAVQGTLKSLLQHHNSKTSIL